MGLVAHCLHGRMAVCSDVCRGCPHRDGRQEGWLCVGMCVCRGCPHRYGETGRRQLIHFEAFCFFCMGESFSPRIRTCPTVTRNLEPWSQEDEKPRMKAATLRGQPPSARSAHPDLPLPCPRPFLGCELRAALTCRASKCVKPRRQRFPFATLPAILSPNWASPLTWMQDFPPGRPRHQHRPQRQRPGRAPVRPVRASQSDPAS